VDTSKIVLVDNLFSFAGAML